MIYTVTLNPSIDYVIKVDNLANETNKEENRYLRGALKKEDYIKSIEVANKKHHILGMPDDKRSLLHILL